MSLLSPLVSFVGEVEAFRRERLGVESVGCGECEGVEDFDGPGLVFLLPLGEIYLRLTGRCCWELAHHLTFSAEKRRRVLEWQGLS